MKYIENFEDKLDKYAEIIVKIGANVQKDQKVWIMYYKFSSVSL